MGRGRRASPRTRAREGHTCHPEPQHRRINRELGRISVKAEAEQRRVGRFHALGSDEDRQSGVTAAFSVADSACAESLRRDHGDLVKLGLLRHLAGSREDRGAGLRLGINW